MNAFEDFLIDLYHAKLKWMSIQSSYTPALWEDFIQNQINALTNLVSENFEIEAHIIASQTYFREQFQVDDILKHISVCLKSQQGTGNKKKYYTQIADYGETKLYSYYRENMGSIVYFTTDVKKETVEIPKMQFVGMTWYQSDSTWKYTIISVNDTLKTPKYSFLKCLVIESEDLKCKNSNNCYKKYLQFYQRGRGYVGTEISGLLYTYMVIEE